MCTVGPIEYLPPRNGSRSKRRFSQRRCQPTVPYSDCRRFLSLTSSVTRAAAHTHARKTNRGTRGGGRMSLFRRATSPLTPFFNLTLLPPCLLLIKSGRVAPSRNMWVVNGQTTKSSNKQVLPLLRLERDAWSTVE